MHWYQTALLMGAVGTALFAWNLPRAVFWIVTIALSFVASSIWHDLGLPRGAAFGAYTNVIICLMMYAKAEKRWELRVWNCMHLMILIDILYVLGVIKAHYAFAVALEICNWLALLVIFTAALTEGQEAHGRDSRSVLSRLSHHLHRALHAARKRPPFWRFH